MASKAEAVEALTELSLSEYEARCFVALSQLSDGTAQEISQVSGVPQSRVYDISESLHRRGVVDIQESDPRRYFALPVEYAIERLRQEYNDHLETANKRLQRLETREIGTDAVWEIADRKGVRIRMLMHIEQAEDEIYLLVATEELLDQDLLDALAEANERGVTIFAEVPQESARNQLYETVPGCQVAITDLTLEPMTVGNREPGRLIMVDQDTVLMSALKVGLVPGETEETGLWGSEVGHGLIAWFRPLLLTRIERLDFESADD